MDTHPITLNCHSNAELNAYKSLALISGMYEGRTDYRIIGGQMVNLLLAAYPVPDVRPRATQDADTAIEDIELLLMADDILEEEGFRRIAGGAFAKGEKDSPEYQEINYLTQTYTTASGIRPVPVLSQSGRQIDGAPELFLVLSSQDYVVIEATVAAPDPESDFDFSVLLPSVELAVLLKAQAVISRNYLDKDLKDLLTLFEIYREHQNNLAWRYDEEGLSGRRQDAVRNLDRISKYLRRNTPEGFSREKANTLRQFINDFVVVPHENGMSHAALSF